MAHLDSIERARYTVRNGVVEAKEEHCLYDASPLIFVVVGTRNEEPEGLPNHKASFPAWFARSKGH